MNDKAELPKALRAAYLTMHRRSDAAFSQLGLTADQFVLLASLSRSQAMTQRELSKRMTSDPSTIRAMLVLLEGKGLVKRGEHPNDSRARTVELTAKGKEVLRRSWKAGEPLRTRMYEALEPEEFDTLISLLNRVAESLAEESVLRKSATK